MRARSTIIGIMLILLSGCGIEPHFQPPDKSGKNEIDKIKGPDVGSLDGALKAQAEDQISRGNFAGAAQLYRQISEKNPDNVDIAVTYADTLRRANDNETALKVIDKVLAKVPGNADALEIKGLCLMSTGEFTDASKAFGDVMKIDDKRWRTLNGIGILFAMKNLNEQAIAYYDAALEHSSNNPSVLNNKGLTLAMDHQYDKAIDTFEKAKRHLESKSPEMRSIDLNLALVYAIAGKLDDAERTAAPHLSKAALYNNMGFYSYLAKNNEMAKGYLNMALTQSPVYYERAWKNLSVLNGDTADNTDTQSQSQPQQKFETVAPPAVAEKTADYVVHQHPHKADKDSDAQDDSVKKAPAKKAVSKDDTTPKTDGASASWDDKPSATNTDANADSKAAIAPAPAAAIPLDQIPESKSESAAPASGGDQR